MHSCSAAVKNYAKLLITEMLAFHISSEIQQFLCFVRQKYTFLWLNVCLQTGHICFGGLSGPWGLLWPFRTFETWRFASTALFIYLFIILPFTLKNKVNVTFCLIYLVVMQYCLVFVINYIMQQICIDKVIIMQSYIIKPQMRERYMWLLTCRCLWKRHFWFRLEHHSAWTNREEVPFSSVHVLHLF